MSTKRFRWKPTILVRFGRRRPRSRRDTNGKRAGRGDSKAGERVPITTGPAFHCGGTCSSGARRRNRHRDDVHSPAASGHTGARDGSSRRVSDSEWRSPAAAPEPAAVLPVSATNSAAVIAGTADRSKRLSDHRRLAGYRTTQRRCAGGGHRAGRAQPAIRRSQALGAHRAQGAPGRPRARLLCGRADRDHGRDPSARFHQHVVRIPRRVARLRSVPGEITTLAVAVPPGRLSVNAEPWAEVWIDNRPMGETPLANLEIPIGEHEVVFRHPDLGERRQNVIVRADTVARVSTVFTR